LEEGSSEGEKGEQLVRLQERKRRDIEKLNERAGFAGKKKAVRHPDKRGGRAISTRKKKKGNILKIMKER